MLPPRCAYSTSSQRVVCTGHTLEFHTINRHTSASGRPRLPSLGFSRPRNVQSARENMGAILYLNMDRERERILFPNPSCSRCAPRIVYTVEFILQLVPFFRAAGQRSAGDWTPAEREQSKIVVFVLQLAYAPIRASIRVLDNPLSSHHIFQVRCPKSGGQCGAPMLEVLSRTDIC